MSETLGSYVRMRARELGLSVSEVCQRAGLSRQTFYSIDNGSGKLPTLPTIMALAEVLGVHPLRLLHLIFEKSHCSSLTQRRHPGDQSAFIRDVNYADGELVLVGQRFTKTWELQNVGKIPWENRFLQCQDEQLVVTTRCGETIRIAHNLVPEAGLVRVPFTPQGALVQVSVAFTAPKIPGTVLSYWKSVFADGKACFPNSPGVWCKVRVVSAIGRAFALR